MAELQARYGEFFTTAVVSLVADEEGATSVHFEAFQCSEQCVKLYSEGWLVPGGDDPKFVATNMEKEVVIVAVRPPPPPARRSALTRRARRAETRARLRTSSSSPWFPY